MLLIISCLICQKIPMEKNDVAKAERKKAKRIVWADGEKIRDGKRHSIPSTRIKMS